jgi:hypothetical protein
MRKTKTGGTIRETGETPEKTNERSNEQRRRIPTMRKRRT